MAPSLYSPLPTDTFSIRLIKLQPSEDISAPVHCTLVTYPIASNRIGAHSYECLSYVWGSPDDQQFIHIDTEKIVFQFPTTRNLYKALLHLRDPSFEQLLWIDAICINQDDDEEKTQQVAAMAKIYGLAKGVVVWLGEEADQSALAFQALRSLAQRHSVAYQFSPGDGPELIENANEQEDSGETAEQPIHALLNRPYFRRMWILQEVTAARNILFKCGSAELQTATFLAGLHALKQLDDWGIRSRIRSFLLLIKTSAFRENLKGQTHLNIEPLTDLIDRFHTHDATDPRDKIYALWGLSSDSKLMGRLQPDYKKQWKDVLEELGKLSFGKEVTISASHDSQMMFVRTTGYDLGRVEEISNTERIWENTQDIKITSMRASRFLDYDQVWSLSVRMRAASEQILEEDLALFLPHASKVIIARPERYYLRIVTIVDSRLVHVFSPNHADFKYDCWRPWQSWLECIDEVALELPLLWSWKKSYKREEQDALKLMNHHTVDPESSTNVDDSQALVRAQALSDMAALFMECDEYHDAFNLLTDMVGIYHRVYGAEAEITVAGRGRLADALDRKATYQKAEKLLEKPTENKNLGYASHNLIDYCGCTILCEAKVLASRDARNVHTPSRVWLDLASKALSKGVGKDMLLSALRLSAYEGNKETEEDLQKYLEFILEMAEEDVCISASELLAAAHDPTLTDSNLIRLADRSILPIKNLPEILEARIGSKREVSVSVGGIVSELCERGVITSEAVNVVAKWNSDAVSALLWEAEDAQVQSAKRLGLRPQPSWLTIITTDAFAAAAVDQRHILPTTQLLARHADPSCEISEQTLVTYAFQTHWGDQDIFLALVEHAGPVINITESVLNFALELLSTSTIGDTEGLPGILPLLRFRSDLHITPDKFSASISKINSRYTQVETLSTLSQLMISAKPVEQKQVDSLSMGNISDYASLLNLVRYRKTEFAITRETIRNAFFHNAHPFSLWSLPPKQRTWRVSCIIEKSVSTLIKHAKDFTIESLDLAATVEVSVSQGFPDVLEMLNSRLRYPIPHFDVVHLIAKLSRSIQHSSKHAPGPDNLVTLSNFVQKLGNMDHRSITEDLKLVLFLHAVRRSHKGGIRMVQMLFERKIVNVNSISSRKETPLHLITAQENECERTHHFVRCVLSFGGGASIDAPDATGRTPRQTMHERRQEKPRSHIWKDIQETFEKFFE